MHVLCCEVPQGGVEFGQVFRLQRPKSDVSGAAVEDFSPERRKGDRRGGVGRKGRTGCEALDQTLQRRAPEGRIIDLCPAHVIPPENGDGLLHLPAVERQERIGSWRHTGRRSC